MTKLTRWFRLAFGSLLLVASAWPPITAAPVSAGPLVQDPQPIDLQAFQLVAPGSGWLLLDQRLYWTSDDGQNWQDLTPAAAGAEYLAAATFVDTQHGWLVTISGSESAPVYRLYRTANGGATWAGAELDLFAPGDPAALSGAVYPEFIDTLNGWLVVKQATSSAFNLGALFTTTDGGDSWTRLSIPAGASVQFTSPQEGVTDTGPPENAHYVTHDGGATWELQEEAAPPTPDPAGVSEISMATPGAGWGRSAAGECDAGGCALAVRLVSTSDGGQTWTPVPLPNGQTTLTHTFEPPASSASAHALQSANGLALSFTGHGFDACPGNPLDATFISKMQTWATASPYDVWNLYIGGTAVASCGTLTVDVLQQLSTQGWLFIPTWVGPQAPCSGFSRRMSSDPATAYQQGVIEAYLAMDRAAALRLAVPGQFGTALYYDLESYSSPLGSVCRNVVKSFISGWTATLRSGGHLSGVYGSPCSSYLADFVGVPNVPDLVWLANWTHTFYDPAATVWNLSCISNSLWSQGQRLRQYTGGHNETWGGALFNIDSDVIDGVVALVSGNCVPAAGQAALFVHVNFGGQCVLRNIGDYANPGALGFPNDSLTSIRLGPNTRIEVCQHDNYGGTCQQMTGSDTDLTNNPIGNDQASSARVMAYTPTFTARFRFPLFRLSLAAPVSLPNGGFESGPAGWNTASARGMNVIVPNNVLAAAGVAAHGGNWAVWMGGVHTETVTLQQTVGVPGEAAILSYWHRIKSSETGCYYDVASIWVNGSVVDSYGLCGDSNGWVRQSVDLSAYSGTVVNLKFQVTTDTSLTSSLFIDDVVFRPGP